MTASTVAALALVVLVFLALVWSLRPPPGVASFGVVG